jgi:hypothetical protein
MDGIGKSPMPRPLLMTVVLTEQLFGWVNYQSAGLHKAGQWEGKQHLGMPASLGSQELLVQAWSETALAG